MLDSPDVLRQLHLVNVMSLERRERELPARLREVFRMGTGRNDSDRSCRSQQVVSCHASRDSLTELASRLFRVRVHRPAVQEGSSAAGNATAPRLRISTTAGAGPNTQIAVGRNYSEDSPDAQSWRPTSTFTVSPYDRHVTGSNALEVCTTRLYHPPPKCRNIQLRGSAPSARRAQCASAASLA